MRAVRVRVYQRVHLLILLVLLRREGGCGRQGALDEMLQRHDVLLLLLLRHLTPILKIHHLLNDLANVKLKAARRRLGASWIAPHLRNDMK